MKKIVVVILLIIINCFANGENIKLWNGENGKLVNSILEKIDYKYYKIQFINNRNIFFEEPAKSMVLDINTKEIKSFEKIIENVMIEGSEYKENHMLFYDEADGFIELNIEKGTVKKIGKLYVPEIIKIFYNKYNDTIILTDLDSYKVYDIKRKKIIKIGESLDSQILDVTFSPEGKYIVMSHNGSRIIFVNSKSYKIEKEVEVVPDNYRQAIYTMKYTPDGKTVVCGSEDGNIYYIDAVTKKVVKKFKAHKGVVMTIDFNLDGTKMVTGSGYSREKKTTDDRVKIWNVSDGKQLFEMKMDMNKENESAYGAAFTPDGKYIVTYPTFCGNINDFGL